MSPRQAAIILYGLSSVVAIFSLLYSQSHNNQVASVIVLVFCAVAWMGIQYLGYAEFTFAGRLLFGGDLQRALRLQLDLEAFESSLGQCGSAQACARLIQAEAPRFGFSVSRIQLAGEGVSGQGAGAGSSWQVRIPLPAGDFVELERVAAGVTGTAAGPFLDVLRRGIEARLPFLVAARDIVASGSEAAVW